MSGGENELESMLMCVCMVTPGSVEIRRTLERFLASCTARLGGGNCGGLRRFLAKGAERKQQQREITTTMSTVICTYEHDVVVLPTPPLPPTKIHLSDFYESQSESQESPRRARVSCDATANRPTCSMIFRREGSFSESTKAVDIWLLDKLQKRKSIAQRLM